MKHEPTVCMLAMYSANLASDCLDCVFLSRAKSDQSLANVFLHLWLPLFLMFFDRFANVAMELFMIHDD